MNDEPVLYSYRCAACGRRASVHLVDDDHEGETMSCQSCGAPVTLEWDGGVFLDGLRKGRRDEFIDGAPYTQSVDAAQPLRLAISGRACAGRD